MGCGARAGADVDGASWADALPLADRIVAVDAESGLDHLGADAGLVDEEDASSRDTGIDAAPGIDAAQPAGCGAFPEERFLNLKSGFRAVRVAGPAQGLSAPSAMTFAGGSFGGRLLVANTGRSNLLAIDVSSGAVEEIVAPTGWVPGPVALTGVAWDREAVLDGAVYVASYSPSRIFRVAARGGGTLVAELHRYGVGRAIGVAIPPPGSFASGIYVGADANPAIGEPWAMAILNPTGQVLVPPQAPVRGGAILTFDRTGRLGGWLYAGEAPLVEIHPDLSTRDLFSISGPVSAAPPGPFGPALYAGASRLSATATATPLVTFLECQPSPRSSPTSNVVAFSDDGLAMYVLEPSESALLCIEPAPVPLCAPPAPPVLVSTSSGGFSADVSYPGNQGTMSEDGRFIAFISADSSLVFGDTNGQADAFVRDLGTGRTTRESLLPGGLQLVGTNAESVSLSADGSLVAFAESRGGLYLRNRMTGVTAVESVDDRGAPIEVYSFSLSADGTTLAFSTAAALDPADTNGTMDVYIRDVRTGSTSLASRQAGGPPADGASYRPSLSYDGQRLGFLSGASNLVSDDTNGTVDVFVLDRGGGTIERASVGAGGAQMHGDIQEFVIDRGARSVSFSTQEQLDPSDTSTCPRLCEPSQCGLDVYLRDLDRQSTELVSVDGANVRLAGISHRPSISGDGRWVSFINIGNSGPDDWLTNEEIVVRDRQMQRTTRVGVDARGQVLIGYSSWAAMSADGARVAIATTADLLGSNGRQGLQVYLVANLACP